MFWRWGWAKLAGVQLSGYRVRGRVAFKDVYILTVSNIEIVGGNSYILFFRVRILSLGTLLNRSETDLGERHDVCGEFKYTHGYARVPQVGIDYVGF